MAEAVEVVLTVQSTDTARERTLGDMVDAAVTRFTDRFGDDSTSVEVAESDDDPSRQRPSGPP